MIHPKEILLKFGSGPPHYYPSVAAMIAWCSANKEWLPDDLSFTDTDGQEIHFFIDRTNNEILIPLAGD